MKIKLLVLTLALFWACSDASKNPEDIKQVILDLEKKALDRWAMGDPLGYAENFAENATYFDDIGALDRIDGKAALTTYFKSLEGKIPTHNYELVNPKVQIFDDFAILTLRYNASSIDNQSGPPWKSTSIYKLIDGEWKVVHANWSLIKN